MVTATINRALSCERSGASAPGVAKLKGGQKIMKKQTTEFAVVTDNKTVTQVGRSIITQPEVNFKGGSVKWLADEYRKDIPVYKVDCLVDGEPQSNLVRTTKSPVEIGRYFKNVKCVDHVIKVLVATADNIESGKAILTI